MLNRLITRNDAHLGASQTNSQEESDEQTIFNSLSATQTYYHFTSLTMPDIHITMIDWVEKFNSASS